MLEYYWLYVAFKKARIFWFLFLNVISKMVLLFSIPSMVDFRTEWRILTRSLSFACFLSFAYLLSVGFVIETRL